LKTAPVQTPGVVAIKPVADPSNSFVRQFSQAVAAQGYAVRDFDWGKLGQAGRSVAIIHWPFELLGGGGIAGVPRLLKRHLDLAAARRAGMKVIWVAHNAKPHDGSRVSRELMAWFLRSIDGIFYLSEISREIIAAEYRLPARLAHVVSVHGHYLDVMDTPLKPADPVGPEVRLGYFGQIRPYKNLDVLAQAVADLAGEGVALTISGRRSHAGLAETLEAAARAAPNLRLHLPPQPLPDAELEATVDAAHAIVLPYRDILNSGAALFALSRARPVMAPRLGSLIELQDQVGPDWVWLYDGELTPEVLRAFTGWLRARGPATGPDLTAFGWDRVGRDIGRLLAAVG
jgi:glycosyltransferase involved in cell wall biosynthesis